MTDGKKMTLQSKKMSKGIKRAKVYDIVFFWAIAAIPLLMLVFNWLFINLNSVLLAFRKYDDFGNPLFAGVENIAAVFKAYGGGDPVMVQSLKNSVIAYFISVIVTSIIPIIFSYYMFKKMWGSSFFKVIVFLPNIISPIITVTIFKFIVNRVIPEIWHLDQGLLDNTDTSFATVLFYSMWLSFGGGMLVQIGAMNSTDQATIDAGRIDGVGFFGELWHIVLPKSYGVISIGFIMGFSSIFTNQLSLYAFRGENAPAAISTLGYYYYVQVSRATAADNMAQYPFWAAWGLVASAISIPVTFLYRYLVNKLGPSEE